MRHRPARGAGEIDARHYQSLFGERLPDKKNGRHSTKIEADRIQKHSPGTIAQMHDCGKGINPCPRE